MYIDGSLQFSQKVIWQPIELRRPNTEIRLKRQRMMTLYHINKSIETFIVKHHTSANFRNPTRSLIKSRNNVSIKKKNIKRWQTFTSFALQPNITQTPITKVKWGWRYFSIISFKTFFLFIHLFFPSFLSNFARGTKETSAMKSIKSI